MEYSDSPLEENTETRKCPHCTKDILADLSFCPFCNYHEGEEPSPEPEPMEDPEPREEVQDTEHFVYPYDGGTTGAPFEEKEKPHEKIQDKAPRRKREPGHLRFILPVLLCFLSILLFLGWNIARSRQGDEAAPGAAAVAPGIPDEPVGEGPGPDLSWSKRTDDLRQVLDQGSSVLLGGEGVPARTDEALPPLTEGTSLGVLLLDESTMPGDLVDIMWSSLDGGVWKKVLDHAVKVQEITAGVAHIRVTPEEMLSIDAAKKNGRIYAAPR